MAWDDPHYRLVAAFYGDRRARRSGVRYLCHIDEGLVVLDAIGASLPARQAFCLHPIVQLDADLARAFEEGGALAPSRLASAADPVSPYAIALVLEYRSVANEYLSARELGPRGVAEVRLSPLRDVNDMLVADKVQNRKDFERHHLGRHPRSDALVRYFAGWLERLSVSEARYRELVARIESARAARGDDGGDGAK